MQYSEIIKRVRPGDVIRNSSWPEGKTFTVSTEFVKMHTGRGFDVVGRDTCPKGSYDGWYNVNKYPCAEHSL